MKLIELRELVTQSLQKEAEINSRTDVLDLFFILHRLTPDGISLRATDATHHAAASVTWEQMEEAGSDIFSIVLDELAHNFLEVLHATVQKTP